MEGPGTGWSSAPIQKSCKYWTTPADLGSVVSRSVIRLIKDEPAIGWIRADVAASEIAGTEILKLKSQIESLQALVQQSRSSAPAGTEKLSQGADEFEIHLTFSSWKGTDSYRWDYVVMTDWNRIFARLGPLMLHEAVEDGVDKHDGRA